jgi:putative membrane protein
MTYFYLVIKGFFIGIALIIPGLSGGTLAIYLGVYEKLLHAIGHVFSEFKQSLQFLIPLFLGIAISIISLAKLLGYLIDMNSFIVLSFFIGLLLGGTSDIYKRALPSKEKINWSSLLSFLIAFSLVILLIVFGKLNNTSGITSIDITFWNIVLIIILGMVSSMTMIVPGVSGSALLIVLGYYTAIVTNVAGNILDFSLLGYNLTVIIPFAIGAAVGVIAFSKAIEYALVNYTKQTYFSILGFIIASVIAIFFEIKDPSTGLSHDVQQPIYTHFISFLSNNIFSVVVGVVMFVGGYFIAKNLSKLEGNN